MKLFDLSGRVALVTGGNGGIGLSMAEGLAEAGASVAITGRSQSKGEAALASLRAKGARVEFFEADLADPAACDSIVSQTVEAFGRLDILVNNAAISAYGRGEKVAMSDFEAVQNVNVTAILRICRAAYPHLTGHGKIINISSMAAGAGVRGNLAYNTSKAALVSLTRSLAGDWAENNIQVNAILPGFVETDRTLPAKKVPGFSDRVLARTPMARWGRPEDFMGAAVFLASDASNFVTGVSLTVDGGFTSILD